MMKLEVWGELSDVRYCRTVDDCGDVLGDSR
jgi:hypothetical protein